MRQCLHLIRKTLTSKHQISSVAFTTVELLVTLFIAAAFLTSGYQLYSLIIKDGGEARAQARASNIAYDYLQRYKSKSTNPCSAQAILNHQSITADNLSNVTITLNISCPYGTSSSTSKIQVDVGYGKPQTTVSNATYYQPVCSSGYILVPGNSKFSTSDFCVMKYEAKNVSGVATSQAAGTPWVNISQTSAITTATAACTSCHLITEAEWMTIVQNVLGVASNWSGGAVGSGYIPRGNSNSSAATDGTTDLTGINKRTLALSNGEVIWDLAGNVWEWTSGQTNGTTAQEPGITGAGWAWHEWTTVTAQGSLAVNPFPSSTGISGASGWNSSNGIGQLYSNADITGLYGFLRGGDWSTGSYAGVLALNLSNGPSDTYASIGFRVVQGL